MRKKKVKIKKLYFELGKVGDEVHIVSNGLGIGTHIFINDKEVKSVSSMQFSLQAGEIGKLQLEMKVISRPEVS